MADGLVARHDRQTVGRQVPHHQLEVGPADGAGGDPDEQLARARPGLLGPGQVQAGSREGARRGELDAMAHRGHRASTPDCPAGATAAGVSGHKACPGAAREHGDGVVERTDGGETARAADEGGGRGHLGTHRPAGERAIGDAGGRLGERQHGHAGLAGRPATETDGRDIGQEEQRLGPHGLGEQHGGEVLVDHGLQAGEGAIVAAGNGDAAAARGDDDGPAVDEGAQARRLHDLERCGRGHDAPPAGAVARDRPATGVRQVPGGGLVVDRPDRFGGGREGRVGGIHDGARQDDRDRPLTTFADEARRERLRQQVPDLAHRLRHEHVERRRRHRRGGRVGLDGEEADLRAVAVGQHELVAHALEVHEGARRPQQVVMLDLDRAGLAAADQGVAAQRDDDARHGRRSPSGSPVSTV